jgi:carboxyl-terminal processing protease
MNKSAEEAYNSYLQALDDKSYYFSAERYKELKVANTGVKKSFGISQIVFADTSYIFRIEEYSSADSNGILPGWRLLAVDVVSTVKKEEAEINKMLIDTVSKSIELKLLTLNGDIVTKKINNSPHKSSSINANFMLNDSVGYIKSLKFTANAGKEFKDAITTFPYGMKALVIDLRDNPGGVLEAVGNVISLFLEEGKQVIKTASKHEDYEYSIASEEDGQFIGLPLVLLVNKVSASASELFAGAVQDYDLGIVVGERTYGKGTLQKHWEFKDGSAFRITVGEYVTPLGRKVQKYETTGLGLNYESFDENLNEALNNVKVPEDVSIVMSSKGRTLISIGGIMPDSVISDTDTLTKLTKFAKKKRVILKTAIEIFLGEWASLKKKYKNEERFGTDFQFNEKIYPRIKNNLLAVSLQNDEMFEKDKDLMADLVKARLAQFLYGDRGYYASETFSDDLLDNAIRAVNGAQKLVRSD